MFNFLATRVKGRVAALALLSLVMLVSGCATSHVNRAASSRPFLFDQDTFAYPNELTWEYRFDAKGKWSGHKRQPPPEYALHCFVVARTARQFFENATFDPNQPKVSEGEYRSLVRKVASSRLIGDPSKRQKIMIPGY